MDIMTTTSSRLSQATITTMMPRLSPIRPNTEELYKYATETQISLPSITLHPQGIIANLLQTYPDREFVKTLITIATYGARIGYQGPIVFRRYPNHKSAIAYANVISESIQSELNKGRIQEPTKLSTRYFCSPIGLVPTKIYGFQTGWRIRIRQQWNPQ
jgi:hypothetical protein